MPSIVAYRKHIDYRTLTLALPQDSGSTELCTIAGTTYVSLPDGVSPLTDQPAEIADTITTVDPADTATIDAIKAASPHVQLINQRVVERIRERYTIEDEIKMIRIAPSEESTAYGEYVEECRAWGREQKATLGLN